MASVDGSSSNSNIKRRRTTTVAADHHSDIQKIYLFSDLTIGILDHTASFLAPPSRAIFAVALTNDNHKPNENSSSIAAADDWDTLDFGEIEKELAARLSDYDISDVLQHVNAVNTVKRLRLTNCTQISGICLEPLRGSKVVEQIDLSLVGDGESPRLDPEPPISYYAVMPILDSITRAEGCSLKHLQFPYKWRRNRSTHSEFHAFIGRYNEMRGNRGMVRCLNCEDLPRSGLRDQWILTRDDPFYGTHRHNCCQCTNNYYYCDTCLDNFYVSEDYEDDKDHLRDCSNCQRDYCAECVKVEECRICNDWVCEYCVKFECNKCNGKICSGCIQSQNDCKDCGKFYCVHCIQSDEGILCDQEGIFLCEGCKD
jgi:hypothetical protein